MLGKENTKEQVADDQMDCLELAESVVGEAVASDISLIGEGIEEKAIFFVKTFVKEFEKVVEQAALKSGISMHRLNIDYMGMQKEIIKKVMSGQLDEISGVLKSYVEKACPGREAVYPGKLSPKKFMIEFNRRLNVVLDQPMQQMLHNGDDRLEVDGAKQMSLEPQSYLSNASVQGHLTQAKRGYNLIP